MINNNFERNKYSAVTKISSCQVHITSSRLIRQLGISIRLTFPQFSYESN